MRISSGRTPAGRSRVAWYVRIGVYLGVLVLVAYLVNGMRGRIPQAFGLTPIRVKVLSVRMVPVGSDRAGSGLTDVSVAVRIVGQDSLYEDVCLGQFFLIAAEGTRYRPYASSFLFGVDGALTIARNDTLTGELLFALPANEQAKELWWEP